jgi:hypothetical protein
VSPEECGGHTKQVTRKAAHCGWGGDAYFNQPNSTYQKSSGPMDPVVPCKGIIGSAGQPCLLLRAFEVFGVAPVPPLLRATRAQLHAPQFDHRLLRAGHADLALGIADGQQVAWRRRLGDWNVWGQLWICLGCKIIYLLMLWCDFYLTNFFMSSVLLWLLYAG